VFYPARVRWDNLRVDQEADERLTLPLLEQGAIVRTFDTPEFRGMTFYEVRAKSIINKVPEASRVPFRRTINPYRGCSHSCAYCMSGDTPILMADGRTKPLSEVRPADKIYGTVRAPSSRRYVTTHVRAHWSTTKPAYRVTLEDGTELVASGDHRFLTERGWKHVADNVHGPVQRAHLTVNNRMLGTGRFASPPDHNEDYRRGNLCGMIRGDANLAAYTYTGRRKNPEVVHRFRLALVDLDGLRRTREFLFDFSVATDQFEFQRAAAGRRPLMAIRTQARAPFERITQLVDWPDRPSLDWTKGFLAGIFDAEGGYCGGILRISNTDPTILERIEASCRALGFRTVREPTRLANGLTYIRVPGGLRQHIRLFVTIDPAITRKRTIEPGRSLKTGARLRVAAIEPLGIDLPMYDITTGTGDFIANGVVSHNCFARNTHTYLDLDYGKDFDTKVVVKVNAPELLRHELASKRWKGEHIAMGTNVDPYQRAEGRYRLMRGILEALRDHANPFSILTKGTLILRDLDLLRECAAVADVGTNVSVGFVDRDLWRAIEPGTPAPASRLEACRKLNDAGVPCGVLMAPIIPFLTDTDESLEATVRLIAESGATHASPIVLHLRTGAREWFLAWLAREHAELVPRYEKLFARGAYAPKAYQNEVSDRVRELARRYGVGSRTAASTRAIRPAERPEQLSLV
jgi:DNA repair photolyase